MTDVDHYLMTGPEAERYYKQTEQKHFPVGASSTGSEFRDERAPTLRGLLELAASQRGGLDGDDHHVLGDPGRDGVYYLAVEVDGVNGAVAAKDLPPESGLLVSTSKEGVPPDYLVFGLPRPETTIGTLVMADERDQDGQLTGKRILITCHPGLPMAPAGKHRQEHHDNTVLAASEIGEQETILVGDISSVGEATLEALGALLGLPIRTNEDMGRALGSIAHLPEPLREKAQAVMNEAWRIDDGIYEDAYNTDLANDLNSMAARELRGLIAEHASKMTDVPSRVRMTGLRARDQIDRTARVP